MTHELSKRVLALLEQIDASLKELLESSTTLEAILRGEAPPLAKKTKG